MVPRKLKVSVAAFCYGGNGAYAAQLPDVGEWWAQTVLKAKADPRIESIYYRIWADTPIYMTRNAAVHAAQQAKCDVLLMIDSDIKPDIEPDGKPFWDSSFDKIYEHYEKGPLAIFAPCCGPPPDEEPYVFLPRDRANDEPDLIFKNDMMTRQEASMYSGFVDVLCGATGLIMYDMRCFDHQTKPYFDQEWRDAGPPCHACGHRHSPKVSKASTEDVFNLRNLCLSGMETLGYNPVLCNFDSWVGHAKNKIVRKPRPTTVDQIHVSLREAVLNGQRLGERVVILGEHTDETSNGHLEHTIVR